MERSDLVPVSLKIFFSPSNFPIWLLTDAGREETRERDAERLESCPQVGKDQYQNNDWNNLNTVCTWTKLVSADENLSKFLVS